MSIHKINYHGRCVVLDEQLNHYVFIGTYVQCKAFIESCQQIWIIDTFSVFGSSLARACMQGCYQDLKIQKEKSGSVMSIDKLGNQYKVMRDLLVLIAMQFTACIYAIKLSFLQRGVLLSIGENEFYQGIEFEMVTSIRELEGIDMSLW